MYFVILKLMIYRNGYFIFYIKLQWKRNNFLSIQSANRDIKLGRTQTTLGFMWYIKRYASTVTNHGNSTLRFSSGLFLRTFAEFSCKVLVLLILHCFELIYKTNKHITLNPLFYYLHHNFKRSYWIAFLQTNRIQFNSMV